MKQQKEFSSALLNPNQACPANITTWNGSDPRTRFAVYRNNVVVSLIEAIVDSFPVVEQLVGKDFFYEMAKVFIRQHPPSSRILSMYGAEFPDFIQFFPPAKTIPYLADVARLEFARIKAYHAEDIAAVNTEKLSQATQQPEKLDLTTFTLHPSVQVISSNFAVFSLWAAHQGELEISQIDPSQAEHVMIVRHNLDVNVIKLEPGAALFIQALFDNTVFSKAANLGLTADNNIDLSFYLALLVRNNAIIDINTQN